MLRAFGEWEEQELLLIALPHKNSDWFYILDDIMQSYIAFVKAVSKFQKVLLISPFKEDFEKYFSKVPNCQFLKIQTDDTWIRDYGAIDVLNIEDNIIKSYDFTFNAWGDKFIASKDNLVNKELFKHLKGDLQEVDFVFEGGSIDFNGNGFALTTSKCLLNENRNKNFTKEQIDAKIKKLFGLKKIIWLDYGFIVGDDTDSHIDTLARFINEDTIAYCACDDENDEHYMELKKMESQLQETGFNLLAVPLPDAIYDEYGRRLGATYLNFIFINNAFILPIYNVPNDISAKQIFKSAIKDREIISVDASKFIHQNGSLHCASQNRFLGKR